MSSKFVFVTGGVVSSLGKGIVSASLGSLLESRCLRITYIKLDPYINVDPGTMSPLQHGEVFVTEDGAETDLDLGHCERFTHVKMGRWNNFTTGQVYESVIHKERRGDYLGSTVQIIPHVTDEIKQFIQRVLTDVDVAIVEIGGTVGDIEGLPFLEAIRQIRIENPAQDACFIHLTLLPYLSTTGEVKTKPTQHSVRQLREIGIQPDILVVRSLCALAEADRDKIALFCNVVSQAVVCVPDVDFIYRIPKILHEQGLDELVCQRLALNQPPAVMQAWDRILHALDYPQRDVSITIVGKYTHLTESYKSLVEALIHAGICLQCRVHFCYVDSEEIEKMGVAALSSAAAILVPGGFGQRGIEGKIAAIRYAREKNVPFFGICLGMQLAVVEFARHVVGLMDAHSSEFCLKTPDPVVSLLKEWSDQSGKRHYRHTVTQEGQSMRLGGQVCVLASGSRAHNIYGCKRIVERHRHRYEINNRYLPQLAARGLLVSGVSEEGLCEIIEIPEHMWFLACQFHPEFTSNPRKGHCLFVSFLQAAFVQQDLKRKSDG